MKTVQQNWFVIVAMAFLLCLTGLVISSTAFCAGGKRCVYNKLDGTVTDNGTGLVWEDEHESSMNWFEAKNIASGFSLNGHSDWRLPTLDELKGLYKSSCKSMLYVNDGYYWSSSTHASYPDYTYVVHFGGSYDVEGMWKKHSNYMRAVRDAQ